VRLALAAALALLLAACGSSPCGPSSAMVDHVIDGDTIVLAGGDKVRYLLIDAPETTNGHNDCYGQQAADFNDMRVTGKTVSLTYDPQVCKDMYGRWLAYVFVDGVEVNSEEVKQGFACEYYFPPDGMSREQEFNDYQSVAKTNRTGLWGVCNPVTCK
jgi:micrococcal nuclease